MKVSICAKATTRIFTNSAVIKRRFERLVMRPVMPSFDADIRNRIVILVKGILEQNAISTEVTTDAPLVDIGLTSMDMVNLMLGVEAEFDFTIPQDKITPENFQSVMTLERMVASELHAARAA
jgi:acyl carrier protein